MSTFDTAAKQAQGHSAAQPTPRGDHRRTALLAALDALLQVSSLEAINIAEISRRAGVTRSAFYFYFENKAAAVAALMGQVYDDTSEAAAHLSAAGTPQERIEATIRGVFASWDKHEHLCRATLEARATSTAVRELWDADRESFVPVVAAMIDEERAAGRAPGGVPATTLATVLLELNDRMLERIAVGGPLGREELVEGVVTVWLRTIYGRTS